MESLGKKSWIISGGNIPLKSTGPEPAFVSQDKLSILNTNKEDAHLELTLYYEDKEPVQTYQITVKARRVCKLRFNDLIDPLPVPLEAPFGCLINSDLPVVVQFTRMDTSSAQNALAGTLGFCSD